MKSLVAAAAVVVATSTAQAQPGTVAPAAAPVPQQVDTVNEDVALGLSLGGTIASWAALIAGSSSESSNGGLATIGLIGTMFAPSFGHWYSHQALTRGLGIRAVGFGLTAVGVSLALDDIFDESDNGDDGTAGLLMLIGAGMYIAGTVDDIANASGAARKYNARFQDVTLVPTMNAHGGGMALSGRF